MAANLFKQGKRGHFQLFRYSRWKIKITPLKIWTQAKKEKDQFGEKIGWIKGKRVGSSGQRFCAHQIVEGDSNK